MQTSHLIRLNKYSVLLSILIFFILISNFIWLKLDTLPPQGNGLNDILPGISFYRDIAHMKVGLLSSLLKFSFSAVSNYIRNAFFLYPPLVPVSYAVFYLLFGPYTKMELILNSIYLAIALCSIYGIGKKLLNEKAGLLAAFIFSSFPGIIILTRCTYAEFFSMCLTALTLYLLLKTDFLQNRKYSLLLGIALGLTALTKWDFPPVLIGPFILTLWKANIAPKVDEKHFLSKAGVWKNFLFVILIGISIALFWYLLCFKNIIFRFRAPSTPHLSDWMSHNKLLFLIELITYYPLTTINVHLRLFYSFLFILIVIVLIYKIIKNRGQLYLLSNQLFYMLFFASWIIIPYMSFTLTKLLHPSHAIYILPILAIIAGIGVISFRNKVIKVALICLIILYGSYSHLHSFFDFKKLEPFYNLRLYLVPPGKLTFATSENMGCARDDCEDRNLYPPDKRDWKIKDILSFVKKDNPNMGHKPVVLVLDNGFSYITYRDLEYYNLLENDQLYIEPKGYDPSEYPKNRARFDYVIINTVDGAVNESLIKDFIIGWHFYKMEYYKWGEFMINFFQRNKYQLINEYLMPNSTKTKIYKLVENEN